MSIIDVLVAVYKTEYLYCFKELIKKCTEVYMAFLCNVSITLMGTKSQENQLAGIFARPRKVRICVQTSKLAL